MQTEKEVECWAFIQVFRPQVSIVFLPQYHHYHHHHISIVFSSTTTTTTTTATFLLFSLHHHHRHHISIVFAPPPPPHFYCVSYSTTAFLLFLFPPPPPPPPPHFYCLSSTRFYRRLPTAILSSFCSSISCSKQQSWFLSAGVSFKDSYTTATSCTSPSLIKFTHGTHSYLRRK